MTTGATPGGQPDRARSSQEAGRQLRAPAAAGIAGLLFAVLFTTAWCCSVTRRSTRPTTPSSCALFARGDDLRVVIGGLYLAPFAGIMFLWFVAVIRDQIGEREDRFFATVFFGSGILFVALLFVASAIAVAPSVSYRYLDQPAMIGGGDRRAPCRSRTPRRSRSRTAPPACS